MLLVSSFQSGRLAGVGKLLEPGFKACTRSAKGGETEAQRSRTNPPPGPHRAQSGCRSHGSLLTVSGGEREQLHN